MDTSFCNTVKQMKIKIHKSSKTVDVRFQMSDIFFQKYGGISQYLLSVEISQVQLLQKQLDKSLSLLEKVSAFILSIDTHHFFLLFKSNQFLMTLDFYQSNKIVIRMGDQNAVLQAGISSKRENSVIKTESNELQWRMPVESKKLRVSQILNHIEHMVLPQSFNKVSYNGLHFSQNLWKDIKKIIKCDQQQNLLS